jgi:flagellar protein FliJ
MIGYASKMPLPELKKSQRTHNLPKFSFSLETLLRHRDDLEQRERDELFRLTYKYQTELRHHDEIVVKFRETMKELSLKQSQNADQQELKWFYLYLHRLTHEIEESDKRLAQIEKEVQAQKDVVIEASKKKKVLASLKDKREKEFIVETEKREQRDIDELVVTRYVDREPEYKRNTETRKNGTDSKHHS